MRIGIIDSGRGGLAVSKQIETPIDQYILLLDRAFFPYGEKTKEFLLKRAYYLVDILLHQHVDIIILACNTLSIVALPFLRHCFSIPILGVFDFFIPYLKEENIIIGSKHTIQYVKENYAIDCIDGTDLIQAIEQNKDIQKQIPKIDSHNKKMLLLACTHFLSIDPSLFPIPTINQIDFLKEEIKKARSNPSK